MAKLQLRLSVAAVAIAVAGMTSTAAFAGGFAVGTQSGSGTGNAFAGGAAAAEDASVAWYNPAGMTLLPMGKQVAVAGHIVLPSFKFSNQGSTGAIGAGLLGTGNGGDGGDLAVIPNGYFTTSINPNLRFGLAVNVPFGLSTEYNPGWQGQVTALESAIKTININPSLGYKISDTVSIGAGVSIQKIDAKLTSFTGSALTGNFILDADDVGYGFNFGIMAQATPSTRIGFSYRSEISYDLEGTAVFSAAPAFNGNVRADLKVPETASLSVFSTMGSKWEVMADLTHTGWSNIQRLNVIRTNSSLVTALAPGGVAGSTLASLQFNWKDTLRVSVGANYKLSPQTKLRFGLAFDPTPTNDVDRTPRLPDQDRTWLAFGVQYKPNKDGVLEVGYAHEFVKDARVSTAGPTVPAGRLNGSFNVKADILSVQYSHKF